MAMFATLPMYDFPDARDATDAWWTGLAKHLRYEGLRDVPSTLLRTGDLFEQWRDPSLLLSQTCSYILTHQLRDCVEPIAVPRYAAPGCSGASYRSVIIMNDGHGGIELPDFRNSRAVYSRIYSHAGYNSFRGLIAPFADGRPFFSSVLPSGSHLDSIVAIASGAGDIATIDCVIHAFVARYRPELLAGTRVIGYSPSAPAPPYIVPAPARNDAARIRSALFAAAMDPDLAAAREALFLDGFIDAREVRFEDVDKCEAAAIASGYPELR